MTFKFSKIPKKATDLEGFSSLADFMMTTAYPETTQVTKDHKVISFTQQDQEIFVQAFFNDFEPNNALKEAAEAYKKIYLK